MKKTVYTFLFASTLVISCKKTNHAAPQAAPAETKYNCTCKITITNIDHCGADSTYATNYISSTNQSDAEKICKQQNSTVISTSTITTKTCELK